jgi:hypothetical protein
MSAAYNDNSTGGEGRGAALCTHRKGSGRFEIAEIALNQIYSLYKTSLFPSDLRYSTGSHIYSSARINCLSVY